MNKNINLLLMVLVPFISFSQKTIVPGSSDINTSYLKTGRSLYTIFSVKDTNWVKLGVLTYDISTMGNQSSLVYNYTSKDKSFHKKRTSIANAKTLEPISYKFESADYTFETHFGSTVSAKFHYFKDNKDVTSPPISLPQKYIDFNWADQFYLTLPLALGYKATIPEFFYNQHPDSAVSNYAIKEVKSYVQRSPKTGTHDAWLVSILEQISGATYYYVIDKKDHRLWQKEVPTGDGTWEIWVNEELDYQPIKNKLDVDKVAAQITKGNSVITGVAFAKDKRGKELYGLFNTSKKQFAPKGTEITLFPNSPYYEEWEEVNEKIRKKKKVPEVPLDPDFGYCVKKAKVYDDQGHFEFADLMPGTYIILASFDFTNSYGYSYVSGYTDYYNYYGNYSGSTTHYGSARQSYNDKADIEKRVTIRKDGDKEDISLRGK